MSRRYIVNLLGSTMAKTGDQPEDSDIDSSDEEGGKDVPEHVGSMGLVQKTLDGVCVCNQRR